MKCPVCRRDNVPDAELCARCGASLARLRQIAAAAEWHLQAARRLLAAKDFNAALAAFSESKRLRGSEMATQGIAVSLLALGRFGEALAAAQTVIPLKTG